MQAQIRVFNPSPRGRSRTPGEGRVQSEAGILWYQKARMCWGHRGHKSPLNEPPRPELEQSEQPNKQGYVRL